MAGKGDRLLPPLEKRPARTLAHTNYVPPSAQALNCPQKSTASRSICEDLYAFSTVRMRRNVRSWCPCVVR